MDWDVHGIDSSPRSVPLWIEMYMGLTAHIEVSHYGLGCTWD